MPGARQLHRLTSLESGYPLTMREMNATYMETVQAQSSSADEQMKTSAGEVEESAVELWESAVGSVPRLAVAICIVAAGWVVARLVRRVLRRRWRQRNSESFAVVISKLVSWIVLGLFTIVAVTVTFPSVKPVDLLAGLGFFSIAVGFAFQDILENTLSGVLLLFRQPFQTGDQVTVQDTTGTVQGITIRETRIITFDGRLIIIPNADVYKNPIVVLTAKGIRRADFSVGVGYDTDLDHACEVIREAIVEVNGVASSPSPRAAVTELGASAISIFVTFWTGSAQGELVGIKSRAVVAAKRALDDKKIEIPFDIVTVQSGDDRRAQV